MRGGRSSCRRSAGGWGRSSPMRPGSTANIGCGRGAASLRWWPIMAPTARRWRRRWSRRWWRRSTRRRARRSARSGRRSPPAIRRTAGNFNATGKLRLVNMRGGGGVRIETADARRRAGRGSMVSGGDGVTYYWPDARVRIDGNIAMGGGGLPRADVVASPAAPGRADERRGADRALCGGQFAAGAGAGDVPRGARWIDRGQHDRACSTGRSRAGSCAGCGCRSAGRSVGPAAALPSGAGASMRASSR